MKYKVMIVEDNADMRETLRSYLSHDGYEVTAVASTEEGIDVIDEQPIDIGLIDINLPGKSGYEMIEYIRESSEIPLIALTARDEIADKLRGFDTGLNDYMVKPFDLKELSARMQAHLLRVSGHSEEAEIKIKNLHIVPKAMKLKVSDKEVDLTNIEFRILHLLMMNENNMVKVDDLIDYVWGESNDLVNPPVRIHIANVRKKIGDKDLSFIKTIPGTGYILNSEDE